MQNAWLWMAISVGAMGACGRTAPDLLNLELAPPRQDATGGAGAVGSGGAGAVAAGGAAGACLMSTTEFLVDDGLPFNTTVPSVVVRDEELSVLAVPGVEPGVRLYRVGFDGTLLGVVEHPGGPGSRLLAADRGFLLVHAGAGQLGLRQLDATGRLRIEAVVELDVEAASDVRVAAALDGDTLGVLYLERSEERIVNHGRIHLATFGLDGSRLDDLALGTAAAVVSPRALVRTDTGWAATWSQIEPDGSRLVLLSEVDAALSSSSTLRLATFYQNLQGGFPYAPVTTDASGSLTVSWLDPRDQFDDPDQLVVWRRSAAGVEAFWSDWVTTRSTYVLDVMSDGDSVASLVRTIDLEEAVALHHFTAAKPGEIDVYDAPGVRDRYSDVERIAGGYVTAGVQAEIGGPATLKVVLKRCVE